jgi:hypothetical protein
MDTTLQYHTIGESSIVLNTLPRSSAAISNAFADIFSFELTVSDIKDGYFELAVSPLLTVKYKNNVCYFETLEKFSIKESEIRNYDLAYHLIVLAIDKFNYILSIQQTNFVTGKKYEKPAYEECLSAIEENYFFSVPQLL